MQLGPIPTRSLLRGGRPAWNPGMCLIAEAKRRRLW
jgi:hypothetical protein